MLSCPQLPSGLSDRKPGSPGSLEQCEFALLYKVHRPAGELQTLKFLVV